jgi:hypothetical protein
MGVKTTFGMCLLGSRCIGQNLFSENHPNQYFCQVGQGWSGWSGLVRLVRVGQVGRVGRVWVWVWVGVG